MKLIIDDLCSIPERELIFTASRSRGPGGQHVNKVNSRLTLHFDVQASPCLTSTQKARIVSALANRINAEGVFRLHCQNHRKQSMNRAELIDRFVMHVRQALTPKRYRVVTKVSKFVNDHRLDQKKRRGQIKKTRSSSIRMDE